MNHGTTKGYWMHVLNLEPPCDDCFEAYKEAHAKRPPLLRRVPIKKEGRA